MAPYEIKNQTLAQIRETRAALSKTDYQLSLNNLTPEKKAEADQLAENIEKAYNKMRITELSSIRDKLILNEEDLKNGIASVKKALNDLKNVEEILTAVGSFIQVIKKIVPLI